MGSQLEKLCEKYYVKISCKFVDTHRGTADESKWEHHEYKCVVRYAGRRLTTPFRQGIGHSSEPSCADVLACLICDARCGEMPFEEYCNELGENPDSMKAHATWRECRKIAGKVRRLLGSKFDEFAEAEH